MSQYVQISDVNLDGQIAEVNFLPDTGGTLNLGYQTLPCVLQLDYAYGEYNLYFPQLLKDCSTYLINPNPSPTPTPTPAKLPPLAFLVPEPQDLISASNLGQYLLNNGSNYFGYYNEQNAPSNLSTYSSDMNTYIHYPGWFGSEGNFISNIYNLSSLIRQIPGTGVDNFGCSVSQYTFGTIEIDSTKINPNIQYNYTIWLKLDDVGGSLTNMTIDIGQGSPCTSNVGNSLIPDPVLSQQNVVVTANSPIPPGIYRILWNFVLPATPPLQSPLYFKGDS